MSENSVWINTIKTWVLIPIIWECFLVNQNIYITSKEIQTPVWAEEKARRVKAFATKPKSPSPNPAVFEKCHLATNHPVSSALQTRQDLASCGLVADLLARSSRASVMFIQHQNTSCKILQAMPLPTSGHISMFLCLSQSSQYVLCVVPQRKTVLMHTFNPSKNKKTNNNKKKNPDCFMFLHYGANIKWQMERTKRFGEEWW